MGKWTKVAGDAGIGLVAGGLDSFIQDKTDEQITNFIAKPVNAGKELSVLSQFSTYFNYGIPLVATIAVAAVPHKISNDMQTRMMVVAGQLVGRKGGQALIDYSKKTKTSGWHRAGYGGEAALAAAEAARAAQAAAGRAETAQSGARGSL